MNNRRVTIKDIAAMANVHPSTVSRALRSEGTDVPNRDRILRIADALGYRTNLLARALADGWIPIVPLLVPDVANSFFPEVARGAEDVAQRNGYSLVVVNTDGDSKTEREAIQSLLRLSVPFIIMAPGSSRSEAVVREFEKTVPFVVVDRTFDEAAHLSVGVDNYDGGAQAARHLLELGHRDLCVIAGPREASTAQHRLDGFNAVLQEHGLATMVIQGGFHPHDGLTAAATFLNLDARPTAVLAANDLVGMTFMRTIQAAGVTVPDDVSVVGFDDLVFAEYLTPSLTTVAQPAREMGRLAVTIGMSPEPTTLSPTLLQPRLVVRESTGPARRRDAARG